MRLLQLLKKKPFCNDLHFFLIGVILLLIGLKYYPLLILLFIYLVYIFKKTNIIIYLMILLLIIIGHISILKIIRDNNKKEEYKGYIVDIIDDNNYIFRSGIIKLQINDYNHNQDAGDVLIISVEIIDNEKNYEADFDYNNYIYSKDISYYAKLKKKEFIKKGFSIYSLKYNYKKYLKKTVSDNSYQYVSALVFGDNIFEENIKDGYSILGISHILAISGLHIIFLFKILSFILLKLFHYYKDTIPIAIITIFIIIIGAPPSAIRALLFLIIGALNRKGNIYYTKLDILSISFILMIIFNPYYFYSIGFILTYLISFILIFSNDILKEKNKYKKLYKNYLLIYFISLPFVIDISGAISILSILLSPFLSLGLVIIIPISYLLSIFPILDYVFKYLFDFINLYINNLSSLISLIHIKSMNVYFKLIYYFLYGYLIYRLANKKGIGRNMILISTYLLLFITIKYIDPIASVTYIGVGQGDSALIRLPYNQGVVLVDAYNSYNYLKSEGIDRIDYLVLTHSDKDHIGDYEKILKHINVKKIIYPIYDDRFNDLLKDYNRKIGICYNKEIILKNTKMEILGPIKRYDDPNSNSIVFKINIYNNVYLFTGDMTKDEEIDLIDKYGNKLDSDILKVAHHGSNTSTTDLFLSFVTPKYSIISVGKKNNYNLPSEDIVKKLNKISKLYMTSNNGNITFYMFDNNLWIKTYK
ncbi:MAG: DNA internalization-related competence protein ComEC/Rec2 [Acholeplasmatales bacterium]|nr:DNA internalization-related competence protein ComEC/Rec2 [Acholeplasmatales bacterium]